MRTLFLTLIFYMTLFFSSAASCFIINGTKGGNAAETCIAEDGCEGKENRNGKLKKYHVMPQIVNLGRELVRINPAKNSIEYSQNGGRSWVMRCSNGSYGTFRDLLVYGNELLACTSKGLYVSTNGGRSFAPRCTNTSSYGDFLSLQDAGTELLANTTKGLYYSRNEGRSWVRR